MDMLKVKMILLPNIEMAFKLFVVLIVIALIIKFINNRNLKQVKNINKRKIFRDIPCFEQLKIAYWLLYNFSGRSRSELNSNAISAYILSWYKDGYIDINVTKKFGGLKTNYDINLKDGEFIKENYGENMIYSFLKAAAKSNNLLEKNEIKEYCSIKENSNALSRSLEGILNEVEYELVEKGLLKVDSPKFRILFTTGKKYTLSQELIDEYENLIGLENFLLDYSCIDEKRYIEVHLWEKYLIFANLLGIADKVKEQFKKIYPDSNFLNKIFEPDVEDTITGGLSAAYKITLIQFLTYIGLVIFVIFLLALDAGIKSFITLGIIFALLIAFSCLYIPLKKYYINKKVKETTKCMMADITNVDVYEYEEYDNETNTRYTRREYTIDYEFSVKGIKYTGRGKPGGFFSPQKAKKIKIYYNPNNPAKNETKHNHNKDLNNAILVFVLISIIVIAIIIEIYEF